MKKLIFAFLVVLLFITGCGGIGATSSGDAGLITSFSLKGVGSFVSESGVITGNNIVVTMPYGADVTAAVATFTTTGTSVSVGSTPQVSSITPNNFSSPVIYTVTAANNVTVTYTVIVTFKSASTYGLSIFAGNGTQGASIPGQATNSPLNRPSGVAIDANGNRYIVNTTGQTVVKVAPDGMLSTVAGTGTAGVSIPGPALSSPLYNPGDIAVDAAGNLYIANLTGQTVVKVTPSGTLSIFAGTGTAGVSIPGPAISSPLSSPSGVAVDANNNVYIVNSITNNLVKVTPDGTLSIIAGTGASGAPIPGPAISSPLVGPGGIASTADGTLYVTLRRSSTYAYAVKITPDGILSITAGNGTVGTPIPGPAANSPLNLPNGIAVDDIGNVYIGNTDSYVVVKVTPSGILSVIVGTGIAGTPIPGPATSSPIDGSSGLAVSIDGSVYIADGVNNVVEKLTISN